MTEVPLINTWSFSRLEVFEKCPFRAKLAFVDKIKVPERPDSPATRGNVAHDALETFVFKNGKMFPPIAKDFEQEILMLRALKRDKRAEGEQMWCFDKDWIQVEPDDYEHIWVRIKLDALAWLTYTTAVAVDYKTGKRYGNEVKHGAQMQLYVIAAFMRFPHLEEITVELWYLDQNILTKVRYRRDQALRHLARWTERGIAMTTAEEFPAKPSTFTCSYCDFKTGRLGKTTTEGTGHCSRNP